MGGKGSGRRRSQPPKFLGTNYSLAFEKFRKSSTYSRAVQMLEARGMKQPFIDNWIRGIFGAGWESTGTKIKMIPNTTIF